MTKNKIPEVFVLGLPNAGKSTLVNALTKRKTSIIGSTPNTTRDKVSTIIEFDNERGRWRVASEIRDGPLRCLQRHVPYALASKP